MLKLICSICGYYDDISEWICHFEQENLIKAYCPQCDKRITIIKSEEEEENK